MKKRLALVLSLTMIASLAACGQKAPETKAPETKAETEAPETEAPETEAVEGEDAENADLVFAWWGNQTRTENTNAAFDSYIEQHPGITIDGMPYQFSDYWTVMATAAAGDALPDIMQQDLAYLTQYIDDGFLTDISSYIDGGKLDVSKISETLIAPASKDGAVYAIPAGINAPTLLYNKTLTDELGIEIPKSVSVEAFNQISKEIFEKSGVTTNYFYGASENQIRYFIRGLGNKDWLTTEGMIIESADEIVPFFDWMLQAQSEGWLMDPAVSAEIPVGSIENDPLVAGATPATSSWCVLCSSNQFTAYQNANQDIELAITTLPSDNQKNSNFLKPSQYFAVTRDASNVAACVQLIEYMTNDMDCNLNDLKGERGIPVNTDIAEALAAAADDGGILVATVDYLNNTVAPECSEVFGPSPNGSNEVITVVGEVIEKVLYGKMTSQEAAQTLFDDAKTILSSK